MGIVFTTYFSCCGTWLPCLSVGGRYEAPMVLGFSRETSHLLHFFFRSGIRGRDLDCQPCDL